MFSVSHYMCVLNTTFVAYPYPAVNAAGRLKREGVHIAAVGVNNYDLYEIRQIASSALSAYRATNAEALHWIQRDLVDDVCDCKYISYLFLSVYNIALIYML